MLRTSTTGYKLLLSYEVKESAVEDYYRFMLGRYVPMIQALGLEMSEAWHTAYGNYPNRLVGFVSRDQETLTKVLNSDSWSTLNQELQMFINDFDYKIIAYQEGFQF